MFEYFLGLLNLPGLQERAGRWEFAQLLVKQSRLARVVFDDGAYRAAIQLHSSVLLCHKLQVCQNPDVFVLLK